MSAGIWEAGTPLSTASGHGSRAGRDAAANLAAGSMRLSRAAGMSAAARLSVVTECVVMAQEAAVLPGPELLHPDTGVPDWDRPLKRARLRPVRRRKAAGPGVILRQVVATLLLAWTLGLVAATASMVGDARPTSPGLTAAASPESATGQDI